MGGMNMGLNRLSRTGLAKKPFYVKSTGLNLWSVEELCFFLSSNLPLIDSEIAGTRLTRWLTEEFRLTALALRMEKAAAADRSSLSGFLMPLFSDTGYFTAPMLKKLSASLKSLEAAPAHVRYLKKADALTDNRLFGEAMEYYRRAEETADPGNRAFLARTAHNRGVAAARMLEYDEAMKEFRKALELSGSREDLKTYLTALRITKPADKYAAEAEEAGADDGLIREIDEEIFRAMEKKFPLPDSPAEVIPHLREEFHRESGT